MVKTTYCFQKQKSIHNLVKSKTKNLTKHISINVYKKINLLKF